MRMRYLPNLLTFFRVFLIPPLLLSLLNGYYKFSFYCFLIAGISDGLDGLLARQYNWQSNFGKIIDPLADKLLLMSVFISLGWLNQLPLWLLIIVVSRDLIIIFGALIFHVMKREFDLTPSFISKANTVLQIFLITSVLFNLVYFTIPEYVINLLIYSVIFTTVVSFFDYLWGWSYRIVQDGKVKE